MPAQTLSQRVAKSRQKAIAHGARRAEVMLSPETVGDVQLLLDNGYAHNRTRAIAKALADAAKPYKQVGN